MVVSLHMDADEFTGKEYNDLETSCSHFQNNSRFAEVVRCKDCRNWDNGDCYRIELTNPNDFCSYGERMENHDTK